jgi:hypothetical protein
MVELEEQKLGSPWSVLPIKNNKYAKDLIEVHLSERGLTGLEKFENFPNLEVIWLNNNNVSHYHITSVSYETWTEYRPISGLNKSIASKISFKISMASESLNF